MSTYRKKCFEGYFSNRKLDYNSLDWSKDDQHLGMITGRSAACIRAKRKELNKPKPTKKILC